MARHAAHGISDDKKTKTRHKRADIKSSRHQDNRAKTQSTHTSAVRSQQSKRAVSSRVVRTDEKPKGKGFIIFMAVACVVIAIVAGTFLYFRLSNEPYKNTDSHSNTSAETVDGQETELTVVTVSGTIIEYNSEELNSVEELENRIKAEQNPMVSLINISADSNVYNQVVTVLNKHGSHYEFMDESNTNPSISTTESTVPEDAEISID